MLVMAKHTFNHFKQGVSKSENRFLFYCNLFIIFDIHFQNHTFLCPATFIQPCYLNIFPPQMLKILNFQEK